MKSLVLRTGWWLTGLLIVGAVIFALLAVFTANQADIIVEWSTASELDTVGYNLYRADSASGIFTKINPSFISASPDPQTGGSYSFHDPNVIPGKTYFYELEAISENGQGERHGPITAQAQSGFPAAWPLAALLAALALFSAGITFWERRKQA